MATMRSLFREHADALKHLPEKHRMLVGQLSVINQWADNELPTLSKDKALTEVQMAGVNTLLDLKNFLGGLLLDVIKDAAPQP